MAPNDTDIIVLSCKASEEFCTDTTAPIVEEAISSLETQSVKKARLLGSCEIKNEFTCFPEASAHYLSDSCFEDDEQEDNRTPANDFTDHNDELPDDFLEPLEMPLAASPANADLDGHNEKNIRETDGQIYRQFWRSGDYDSLQREEADEFAVGVEHVRVHPKFLHSNATSHKWALGAIAELLDNALDETVNGATMVNVDMLKNPHNGCPMLMIEDDGGGMDPEQMRKCMSLGYSFKRKIAKAIGQYGNGFKTSTMRLGADVIVFSRTRGKDGALPTQSIGLLSYTFLTSTGQEDIIVPMIDYEIHRFGLRKLVRGGLDDWNRNLETILQWSPYDDEQSLLAQLQCIRDQGTIIIVYNLWEDDQGELELDFDADPHDIQLRGSNRDERNTFMASQYPTCKHYFTYKYSLRSYASILYLRLPKEFKIMLRGKQVTHHKLVNDLIIVEHVTYRPQKILDVSRKGAVTDVTLGFVKDAKEHIDIQGFNVYHKNRLIKPFWRVWVTASCQGRGIVGVLEVNFIEPAHDKQDFERTVTFSRLEARLIEIQKNYWTKNCEKIGYAGKIAKKRKPFIEEPILCTVTARSYYATDASSRLSSQNKAVGLAISGPLIQESARPVHQNGTLTSAVSSFPLIRQPDPRALLSANSSPLNVPVTLPTVSSFQSYPVISENSARRPAFSTPLITHACTILSNKNETRMTVASSISSSRHSGSQVSPPSNVHQASSSSPMSLKGVELPNAASSSQSLIPEVSTLNQKNLHPFHHSDSSSLTTAIPADGDSFISTLMIPASGQSVSIENPAVLEAKLCAMKQRAEVLEKELDDVLTERDFIRAELEEERERQVVMEGELQSILQTMLVRVNELDSANKLYQHTNITCGLIDKL